MLPGPDQIVACPHCKGLAKYMTLMSGNTFGARVWTDGKQVAPMLPRPPAVVKCRHCAECYWLADAEEVGAVERWGGEGRHVNSAWAAAQEVAEPTEEEYYLALQQNLAKDSQQERNLRVLAWWRRNDAFRDAPVAQDITVPSKACRSNLEALASLLREEQEEDRLMKAEVLRQLAMFEEARQLLEFPFRRDYRHVVRAISDLIQQRQIGVVVVRGDEALTAEEIKAIGDARIKQEMDRAALETHLRAAERSHQEKVKEGKACPKCGFSYAWNGTECGHCHYRKE